MRTRLSLFIIVAALLLPSLCHAQFPAHYLPEFPTFRGSDHLYFFNWVQDQLNLPDQPENQVYLEIIVNLDGSLTIEEISSVFGEQWNKEFEKLIKSSESDWKPGREQEESIWLTMSFPQKNDGMPLIGVSQNPTNPGPEYVFEEPIPFMLWEQAAKFKGKHYSTFYQWVQRHRKYPSQAKKEGIEGTVWVQFTVNKVGDLENVEVLEGVHPLLDEEAVRVISSSPRWTPFKYSFHIPSVTLFIPVEFKLK